jgi:translation initiation factor 1
MAAEKPFHNPFEALSRLRDSLPAAADSPAVTQSLPDTEPPADDVDRVRPPAKGPARAVVRMERSGRGGKEVTVVEQLGLSESQLVEWLKALKSAMGCGGAVEGSSLVLQGDQRKRLPALLSARGVRRVTVS